MNTTSPAIQSITKAATAPIATTDAVFSPPPPCPEPGRGEPGVTGVVLMPGGAMEEGTGGERPGRLGIVPPEELLSGDACLGGGLEGGLGDADGGEGGEGALVGGLADGTGGKEAEGGDGDAGGVGEPEDGGGDGNEGGGGAAVEVGGGDNTGGGGDAEGGGDDDGTGGDGLVTGGGELAMGGGGEKVAGGGALETGGGGEAEGDGGVADGEGGGEDDIFHHKLCFLPILSVTKSSSNDPLTILQQ